MDISIREAGEADIPALSKLSEQTFRETYDWYNTEKNLRDYIAEHFKEEQLLNDLHQPNTCFLLAYYRDELSGYAKLRTFENPPGLRDAKHVEVERIYVIKTLQDKKIGYALMQACIEQAKKDQYEILWLGVWERNEKAINFYKKAGFRLFGEHPFKFGDDIQRDYLFKIDL